MSKAPTQRGRFREGNHRGPPLTEQGQGHGELLEEKREARVLQVLPLMGNREIGTVGGRVRSQGDLFPLGR